MLFETIHQALVDEMKSDKLITTHALVIWIRSIQQEAKRQLDEAKILANACLASRKGNVFDNTYRVAPSKERLW